MAKEMLINVSEGEECRIALVEDGKLEELYMERTSSTSHVGNIYKGKVTNVEASIQAAFVDFGLGRNGFLHISDLMPSYFGRKGEDIVETVGKKMARRDRPPIQRCLRRGDEIVVQIIKEGIGTKGPTLSSYLSIPGKYLVMMPGVGKMGVSQKIEDDAERRRLRQILDGLEPPEGVGFIIRTAGVSKTKVEIERDLKYLTRVWENIIKKRNSSKGPTELYTEGDLVTRTVRDVFTGDVERIVVDNVDVADRVKEVIKLSSPRTKNKVELFEEKVPLFHKYGIEREIELMYSRHVPLPSGGSLVIDSTEAIVAIDVNSGKFRDHSDAETTAFKTDLEAADEIARQLRLRDLGGVIICDFIDLRYERHRRELEERLLNHLKNDRAKTKMLRMSQFGIIEMTRQRMRPSLKRAVYFDCPHCKGAGLVKTHESMSLDVMRKLAIAINDLKVVRAELSVSPEVAYYLQNRNRRHLAALEDHFGKQILVKADPSLGLDEMKLDLFDNRDGLIVLNQLALPSAPHTSQLHTRPHGGGQQGRGGGGLAGSRSQQQGGRGQQQGRRGGPPREDVVEEERYALDRDADDDQSRRQQSRTAPDREADRDEEEYERQQQQQRSDRPTDPRPGGGGARGRDRDRAPQWNDRGGRGERQGQGGGGGGRDRDRGRGDMRPAGGDRGGQQQRPPDGRQQQGQGGRGGGNDNNRGGGGGQPQNRGGRDPILEERDERGRGIENGGEDVIVDEDYDNAGAPGNGGQRDDRGAQRDNRGGGGGGGGGPQDQGYGGEGGEGAGSRRRRRRRRGRRGRGRGGQGGGDFNQPPQQPGGPVQALDSYPADEGYEDRGDQRDRGGYPDDDDARSREGEPSRREEEDRYAPRDGRHDEALAEDQDHREDAYRRDEETARPPDVTPAMADADFDRGDHAGLVEVGDAPAVAGADEEDDTSEIPPSEDVMTRDVAPGAADAPVAETLPEPKPTRSRGGGGRRSKAQSAAGEAQAAGEEAAKRSRRVGGGGGRARSAKASASSEAAGAEGAAAKKSRGGARSRSRKKATAEPSRAAESDPGGGAAVGESAARSEASSARIAPSVPRTGSADKHMADDEPVEHEPVRRPRSFRDLDELPEEFD